MIICILATVRFKPMHLMLESDRDDNLCSKIKLINSQRCTVLLFKFPSVEQLEFSDSQNVNSNSLLHPEIHTTRYEVKVYHNETF